VPVAIAPLVAGWKLGHRNTSAPNMGTVDPVPTPTFPTTRLAFQVQIALDADPSANPDSWNWTDITRYVFLNPGINITRGRQNEQTSATPSRCTLTLRNFDMDDPSLVGLFSPRNPNGPYYGHFGRNTPLRVDVDPGTGWSRRFTGFVSNWPPQWDITGRVKFLQIQADGILRRLGQATTPLKSTLNRAITAGTDVVAYWPMEEGSNSTQFASGIGGAPMASGGAISYAADSGAAGSSAMPQFGPDAFASGSYATATTVTQWRVAFVAGITTKPAVTVTLAEFSTTGTAVRWVLQLISNSPSAGLTTLKWSAYNAAGTELLGMVGTSFVDAAVYGVPYLFQMGVVPSATPGSVDWANQLQPANVASSSGNTGTFVGTVGYPTTIAHRPDANAADTTFAHATIAVNGGFASALLASLGVSLLAIGGHDAEPTEFRFLRLCQEEGLTRALSPSSGTSFALTMGPQPLADFLTCLREVETVNNGVIAERLDGRIALYLHEAFENQAVDLTIDCDLGQVTPPFEPVEDDQQTRNDVTVSRSSGGSFSRQFDQTGPMGIDTIGRYDESITANVAADAALVQQAAYRLVHGTVDEARYPQIALNLARSPELITAWLACDIGARLNVLNTPIDDGPDVVDQVIQGYTEHLDPFLWTAQLNCTPFSPHRVFRLASAAADANEFLGYLLPATCVLAEDLDTTETGVDITSDTLWSTDPDDWSPAVKVTVGGEDMLVSAVSGASNPQTLTVTRSVNGIVRTHSTNDVLEFTDPGVLGL